MQAGEGNLCVCEGRQIKSHHQLNGLQLCSIKWIGGREGIRTPGLLVANEALSQLSYSPTSSNQILANAAGLANKASSLCKQLGALRPDRSAPKSTFQAVRNSTVG